MLAGSAIALIVLACVLGPILLFLIAIIVCAFVRRTANDVKAVEEIPKERVSNTDVLVTFAPCARDVISSWRSLLFTATESVRLVTYRWRVERVGQADVNRHVVEIGRALVSLQSRGLLPDVRILTNQFLPIESSKFAEMHVRRTLSLWTRMGVRDVHKIKFRTWKNVLPNNIHAKFIVVDEKACSLHSANVEGYSHGGEGSWSEVGVVLHDESFASHLASLFDDMWNQSKPVGRLLKTNAKSDAFIAGVDLERERTRSTEPVSVTVDKAWLFWKDYSAFAVRRRSNFIRALVHFLQSAETSIDILTPNLNDVSVIDSLLSSKAKVRVMMMHSFNVDAPWLQETFTGWSNNHQMLAKYKKKFSDAKDRILLRWYGHEGVPVKGKVKHAVHAKMIVVDGRLVSLGSCNLDLYSTIHSIETTVWIESEEFAREPMRLFSSHWANGIPVL